MHVPLARMLFFAFVVEQDIAAARLADKDVDTSSSNNNNNKGRFLDRVPRERTAEVNSILRPAIEE